MNTLEHLIWDEYIRINKELDAEASMERYPEIRFKREYTVFRQGQFSANRIFELGPKTELPHNSLIHIFDNISHMTEDPQDIPRLEECPFIDRESFRKFIYHIKNFNLEGPLEYEDKYIFRQSGLPARLLKFRSQHGSRFRYPTTIAELPTRKESLCIINHNPLFRARFFGRLQTFRKLTLIWTSILNTVCGLTHLNKNQFIYIPWGEEVYMKNLFIKNRDKLTIATVKYPEDPHYFIMMHLINYMWDKSTTSLFSKIPEEALPQINLILTLNGKYLIFNLATIKELNDKNRVYYKFINLLNMLSILGRADTTEETKKLLDRHFIESEVSPSTTENEGVTKVIEPRVSPVKAADTPANIPDTTTEDTETEAITEIFANVVHKVAPTTAPAVVKAAVKPPVETPPLSKKDIKAGTHHVKKNVTTNKAEHVTNSVKQEVKEYLDEGDQEALKFIETQDQLTIPQRKRYTALATKYKTLELDGKPLEKILLTEDDITLDSHVVDPEQFKEIPDKSACESSIVSFDKNYMDKSFNRHLVETVTSFRKQGVFLTDIKTKHEIDRMNNFVHYSLHYEDINGKKSTVKFRVPQVTRDGRLKIDGMYHVLKKQRINVPIVKLSETEVSLASNYNKTRVERNVTKAHNYFAIVDELINSSKSTAQIQFGKCIVNLPLPYEYAVIGEHYRSITFTKDKVNWKLWFDYKTRAEQFDDKEEKMLLLEKEYGTFLGSNNNQWLFIDSNCQVRAIFKSNGEDPNFQYNTLLDLFKLSLRDGEVMTKKQITEFVSIKILDKMLPVVFLLGYQFGLRHVLDHLHMKYTITELRKKTIVGESGTASYDIAMPGQEGFMDWIKKLNYKLFSILVHPISKVVNNIRKWWNENEPDDPHLWKVSIYCLPTSNKKQWKIQMVILTIVPRKGEKFTFRLFSKFNNKIIEREKQLFVGPVAEQLASALKVHIRNIAFADKKVSKDGKLPSLYKNTKEVTPNEIIELSKHETMQDIYFSKVAKHKGIAELAGFEDFNETQPVSISKLPVLTLEIVKPYFLQVLQEYKEHFHISINDLKVEMSETPMNNTGMPTNFPKNQYGACWTNKKIIYVNPYIRDTFAYYSKTNSVPSYEEFYKELYRILAHEVGHEIFRNIASNDFKSQIFQKVQSENFTTNYLDSYDKNNPKYYEESFAEYLSWKLLEKSAIHENLWIPDQLYPERVKHLEIIDKNGLKEQDYFLGASAAAVLYGMPIENADLDICITREAFERLRSNWVAGEQDGVHNNMFQDKSGILDLTYNKDDDWCNFNVFWAYTVNVDGYRYLSWKGLKLFYEMLYNRRHKEKHKTRLDWMNAQEAERNSSSGGIIRGFSGTEIPENIEDDPGAIKYIPKPGDIAIKFSDRILWFNRYPLEKSLVISGLDYFDCSQYSLADMESKDVYYQMLVDKNMSTNYLKGIASFFDLFVDGMTYEVLKKMNEPTTFEDLLIRSAQLLSTTDHLPPSSKENHRIRGFEQFNAIIYNEMSRQMAAYQSKRGKANTFSINPDAIFLRILSNESMVASEGTGPLQNTREYSYMTYAGIGGRSAESFVLRDRAYSEDDIGIVSEATADSTKVAINSMLSMNAGITDTLGTLKAKPMDELNPADVLDHPALLFPFICNDDTKRLNFVSIQTAHMMPIKEAQKCRIRTGYERTLAHMVNKDYAGTAEKDGKVTNIDEDGKVIEVTYSDGSRDLFEYGEKYSEISGMCVTHQIVPVVKLGQKIAKNDIITYNKGFFNYDKYSKQVDFSTGVTANVCMAELDVTNEDSTEISTRLSDKLTIFPTNMRVVQLPRQAIVYTHKSVGDHVLSTDDLLVYEESEMEGITKLQVEDQESIQTLSDLNRRTPSARFNGEIVKIEAYYGCDIADMTPSLAAIVKSAIKTTNRRNKLAKGTEAELEYPEATKMPDGSKYKGVYFDEDTVCLIYYIKETIPQGRGDKLVVCNQLKCTVAGVFSRPIYTESGTEVDLFFSANSVANRIVISPFLHGILNRIVEKIEQDAIDIYFSDEKK